MNQQQQELYDDVIKLQKKAIELNTYYWKEYSSFDTWQFWMALFILIVPLIVLIFAIDREKIFLIGFYGFNIHAWFAYIDSFGAKSGLWAYPYQVIPFFPSFPLDASLVPVTFMLVYQWTLNHNKNFYLYSFITACIFSFILKPLLVNFDLFVLNKNVNYFYLLIVYCFVFLFSRMVTKIFLLGKKTAR
jgi:hypothetical protein